jgi:hypothetical protein
LQPYPHCGSNRRPDVKSPVSGVHQGGLDGAGYFGDPRLIVSTFDKVDLGERHDVNSLFTESSSMQHFDRQRDALTATDAKRDKAARQSVAGASSGSAWS